MSDLASRLASFGMGQYLPRFLEAGFESWETILDITEDDLDSLGVQRGHRRRLQQQIAYSIKLSAAPDDRPSSVWNRSLPKVDDPISTGNSRKRQYTRRPKPDPKAPRSPPTAHVLFSNALRDELKDQPLSSVDKTKIVGERWDNLPEEDKSQWRQGAAKSLENYESDQTRYQNTNDHQDYQAYLAEVHAPQSSKRRMVPSNNSSTFADHAAPHPKVKRPSDEPSSSVTRHLAPAPAPAAFPTPNQIVATSSPVPIPARQKKPKSNRRDPSSYTAPPTRGKSVKGFSHACESCRKRKAKCDGAVPTCERCLKTGTECLYEGGIRDQEKRLVEAVVEKLNMWEEAMRRMKPRLKGGSQSEVDRLLALSPRTSKPGKLSGGEPSQSDGSYGGESDISNVGSMGSTDNINEETFKADAGDGRIDAFLGQTATDNWVDRLQNRLNISDKEDPQDVDHSSKVPGVDSRLLDSKHPSAATGLSSSTLDAPTFGDQFEPYELPEKAGADSFVGAYFTTVHPSFPIISRAGFLQNYEDFFAFSRPRKPYESAFVPILHLVLAIGAFHVYATQAPWVRDERTRLLNFARAKATVLEAHILQATAYEQVQLCGLGALYYLVMYKVNK
ncbi:MAG: hypothetical protein Q9216_002296 [Gyalolechia sp. 2 TL-2023]